jgi:hypothetical protein
METSHQWRSENGILWSAETNTRTLYIGNWGKSQSNDGLC